MRGEGKDVLEDDPQGLPRLSDDTRSKLKAAIDDLRQDLDLRARDRGRITDAFTQGPEKPDRLVKATQKITKAMQMVAAAKLRRAQEAAEAARPYAERMAR
jgi:hypothetical protein